jgi:hypothetical protein
LNPAFIWDLALSKVNGNSEQHADFDLEESKKSVFSHLIPVLEGYKEELEKERNRQAGIKEKYGIHSLEHLILSLDHDLIGLYDRRERGEKVDLVIGNKETLKSHYEIALEKLRQTIDQERTLTMGTPTFVGVIRVVPKKEEGLPPVSDDEIERIGMEHVMEYERRCGRVPEDVSADNMGYDIRSTGGDGKTLYVEVKARAGLGAVTLTQNEWFKAQRFGEDYYLYVVFEAASNPELQIIKNPAATLSPEQRIESVRYVVDAGQILDRAEDLC